MCKIPVIGHKFTADFGEYIYELYFKSNEILIWKPLFGDDRDPRSEKIKMHEIRTNVFLVSWQEKDGSTITHLEDFENEIVYSNITTTDGTFLNLKGKLKPIKL